MGCSKPWLAPCCFANHSRVADTDLQFFTPCTESASGDVHQSLTGVSFAPPPILEIMY